MNDFYDFIEFNTSDTYFENHVSYYTDKELDLLIQMEEYYENK